MLANGENAPGILRLLDLDFLFCLLQVSRMRCRHKHLQFVMSLKKFGYPIIDDATNGYEFDEHTFAMLPLK